MNKFHQIPTDTFLPISHDNSYLFSHYEKVANFLKFNLDKNYKNILGKPVQNGFVFDWFSAYENLVNINEKSKEETETELVKYWNFIEVINEKIKQLAASGDENNKNWASLLTKVFNHQDNFIFSNGIDICIVWGWKFDNTKNYKPDIVTRPIIENVPVSNDKSIQPEIVENLPIVDPPLIKDEEEIMDNPIEETPEILENTEVENFIVEKDKDNSSFLKFLKWFASKFWWWLWLLLLLIIFFLLVKSCECNEHYNDIDSKLNQLEQKANNCCN